jgi:hypothetical protein
MGSCGVFWGASRYSMTVDDAFSAGDALPSNAAIIEVRVTELQQLFHTIDPTPFRDRDLDPNVEEFITDWSREIPGNRPLALLVHVDRRVNAGDVAVVRDAVRRFFADRAAASRARLRRLFRFGRISLAIGLGVLAALIGAAQLIGRGTSAIGLAQVLQESLLIGGWVAMWRPLEVFLYDWWPIRAEARLFDRLAAMPVRLSYGQVAPRELA